MMVKNLRTKGNGGPTGFLLTEALEEACKNCQTYALINDSWELLIQAYEKQFLLDDEEVCFLNLRLKSKVPPNQDKETGIVIPYQRIDQDGRHWFGRLEITHKGCLLSVLDRETEVTLFYRIAEVIQEKSLDYWSFEEHTLLENPLNSYITYQLGEIAL